MIPKVKKELQTSDLFQLRDLRFEVFDNQNNRISGKPATLSEIAIQRDCPYILKGYGRRMFTDISVASRIFSVLGIKKNLSPSPKNIEFINDVLQNSLKKKTFYLSLTEGLNSANMAFSEVIIMDVVDPRRIKKDTNIAKEKTEEEYDR